MRLQQETLDVVAGARALDAAGIVDVLFREVRATVGGPCQDDATALVLMIPLFIIARIGVLHYRATLGEHWGFGLNALSYFALLAALSAAGLPALRPGQQEIGTIVADPRVDGRDDVELLDAMVDLVLDTDAVTVVGSLASDAT